MAQTADIARPAPPRTAQCSRCGTTHYITHLRAGTYNRHAALLCAARDACQAPRKSRRKAEAFANA